MKKNVFYIYADLSISHAGAWWRHANIRRIRSRS